MSDSDSCIPPPSYQLSQQGRDEKITEKLLILSKIPLQDVEEEGDGDDNKDKDSKAKEPKKQPSFYQTPALRIQKRTPRGARPLPPTPADVQSRSRPADPLLQDHQVIIPPPPPSSTTVGPSFDGHLYELSKHHVSDSAAPSSLRPPFHSSPAYRGQQRPSSSYSPAQPHADSYRRISHNPYLESSSSSSSHLAQLKFDSSIAYSGTSSNTMDIDDLWERPSESTSVSASSLYSSAVLPYLHPASASNPGPRSSYNGARNRYPTPSRPSTSSSVTLTPAGSLVAPALPFRSPYTSEFSASHQSLSRPRSNQGYHVRWASSEAEFTRDIYP